MKLYVWEDMHILGWSTGVIFVIAANVREARKHARNGHSAGSTVWTDTERMPDVYNLANTEPRAWLVWGG